MRLNSNHIYFAKVRYNNSKTNKILLYSIRVYPSYHEMMHEHNPCRDTSRTVESWIEVECCCNDFHKMFVQGYNDGPLCHVLNVDKYSPELSVDACLGDILIGCELPTIKYCPFCGIKISKLGQYYVYGVNY